ncbi:MAG: glycogen synthase, partial [Chloroflexota bacterium]
ESPPQFHRPTIYSQPDDLDRFAFFALAALEAPRAIGWQPDVVHAHDWHSALAVARLRATRAGPRPAAELTIHNVQYQGNFGPEWLGQAIPDAAALGMDRVLASGGNHSVMALGIAHADAVNTVSETYAREILTPEYGYGMERLLQSRGDRLCGIINGIDYQELDPATDPALPVHYSADRIAPRARNKAALQRRAGLPEKADVPVLGMVTRLADQKGLDILAQALPAVLEMDVQFILLGTGQPEYHKLMREVADRHKDKAAFVEGFDPSMAQLIYAGCDVFLMPSRFEPCGLGQLIALRYGAIPLARRTGGLADTVRDCGESLDRGNGFVFERYDAGDLVACIRRAAQAYQKREAWRRLMVKGMRLDFSWDASARKYVDLYGRALEWASEDRGGVAR